MPVNPKSERGGFVRRWFTACPVWFHISFFAALLAVLAKVIAMFSAGFADAVNNTVGLAFRFVLAKISGIVPFSLSEAFLVLIPLVFVILLIVFTVLIARYDSIRRAAFLLASLAFLLLALFLFCLGIGYETPTLEEKLGLEKAPVTADQLFDTAMILSDRLQTASEGIGRDPSGASVMPYSLEVMNDKLNAAYRNAAVTYPFIRTFSSRAKPVALSHYMSYTHITGVYTYFTGEANLNIAFPDYTLPYTEAHEMSHQRGFSREDECNFMAFLVLESSDDPYLRYCGYANLLEYVMSALYEADTERYGTFWRSLPVGVQKEYVAYNAFFEPYRESAVSEVSETINNTYLKTQGEADGAKSYGRVVDLAVAYFAAGERSGES